MRLICALFAILMLALPGLAQTKVVFREPKLSEGLNIVRPENVKDDDFIQYASEIAAKLRGWEKENSEKMKGNYFQIFIGPSDRFPGSILVRIVRRLGTMAIATPSGLVTDEVGQIAELYLTPKKHPVGQGAELIQRRINAMLVRKLTATSH